MRRGTSRLGDLPAAAVFLLPNLVGVLVFTVFPVVFSVVLALSNWDLRLHNMYKDEPLRFVGLDNFVRLFTEADFVRFLGNTLFLMMGIPFAMAGSLVAAMLLSEPAAATGARRWRFTAGAVLVTAVAVLAAGGMGFTGMTVLLIGVVGLIAVGGAAGGTAAYRTLFYAPHFTAGVATFLLWKKLYNPLTGPISAVLRPVLGVVEAVTDAAPGLVRSGRWAGYVAVALLTAFGLSHLRRSWRDGEVGTRALLLPAVFLLTPTAVALLWPHGRVDAAPLALAVAAVLVWQGVRLAQHGRPFRCSPSEGAGSALMLGLVLMTGSLMLLGLGAVCWNLPAMAASADGLQPPNWLADYHWAKPSLMIMGLWAAIGSNNMLLYLAALSNVPQQLYEAADIDGARRFQRFWHVTWPQLAPTTFFIAVMSTIYGLQGGFEMARTMTQGGPDGATVTLSYFIYTEGFETGRLGFAAAIAWTLFLLVFALTMFNWRFGNSYVDE